MSRSVIGGNRNSISRELRSALKVEGLKETTEKLAGIVSAVVGREMKLVYYDAGKVFRDEARTRAPFDPDRKKGTHLREAVFVSWGRDEDPNVLVGVRYGEPGGAPHAHLQEYGWHGGVAQPYIRPAGVAVGPRVGSMIGSGLVKIVERFSS